MNDEYQKFIEQNPKLKELDPNNLPEGLKISTMTITCKLPLFFNANLIAKHIKIDSNFIIKIKYGNNSEIFRHVATKKNKKKFRTGTKNFFNQVSLLINMESILINVQKKNTNKKTQNVMNIKFFKNGSLQLTGCKNISSVVFILDKLFSIMKMPIKSDEYDEIKYFANPVFFLDILDLYDLKIAMINSDFSIGFDIDRNKLFSLIKSEKNAVYDCVYDSSRHAAVMIHYSHDEINPKKKKKFITTIIVFAKGKIIITGTHNYMRLIECYKFINIYLIENYQKIASNLPALNEDFRFEHALLHG